MQKRSAEASIKGYSYQFLHSIVDLLEQDNDASIIIEGIEDLDVNKLDYTDLYQYKYHELATFQKSKVGKPIGLMFNHFLNNQDKSINYILRIYLDSELPHFDKDLLMEIFKLKAATQYIDNDLQKYKDDESKVSLFTEKFQCIKAEKYSVIEETVANMLKNAFNVSESEAKLVYLPNAVHDIIALAMENTIDKRTLTAQSFKDNLKRKKDVTDIAYIRRIYGEEKAISELKKRKKNMHIKPNNSDHIVFIDDTSRHDIPNLILQISKLFFYEGNKNDYRPVTFIVNEVNDLKKDLYQIIDRKNEIVLINDGHEDYKFSDFIFNRQSITTNKPIRNKVNDVNYNFKLISYDTFRAHEKSIKFSNPTVFYIGKGVPEHTIASAPLFVISSISNEAIISVLGV